MVMRFTPAGRAALDAAVAEARRRGERRLGCEHLLLGLLADPSSVAAAALGIDLAAARSALEEMDREALALVGLATDPATPVLAPQPVRPAGRLPFTAGARAALERCVREAGVRHARRLEPTHLALAVLACRPPEAAAEVVRRLDVDTPAVRRRLDEAAA